jgi:hypothetical protein
MTAVFPSMPSMRGSGRRSTLRSGGLGSAGCPIVIALGWAVLFCSALAQVGSAEGTQIPSGPYRIAGTVVSAKAGNALGHCRVTITDSKNRQSAQFAITGDDGRFEFHVPAGKYSLEGAKRGFITSSYNQHDQFSSAIVTGADLDTENLSVRLAANAVLTGRVLDEFSEPVRNAQIMVYREEHRLGVSRTSVYRGTATDDQGRYEVTPLDEGTYFVSAKASPWYAVHPVANAEGATNPAQVDSSLDVAYPITYYGDATEAEDATPIPVRGGDRLEADIHMNPVPALHLIVHVPQGGNFPMLYKPVFDGAEQLEGHSVESVAPGVYELSGIAAGRYTVRMPESNGHMNEPTEVDLTSGGELDVSSARSTSQIKATTQLAGAGSLPADLHIILRPSKGKTSESQIDAKGDANFSDIVAGKYDVLAVSPTQRFSVVRIASEAGTISGHVLNVPAGASVTIALSIAEGSVTVEGFAKRNGKAVAGAMIVLVPKNAEGDSDRIRRDESDLDGSFSLHDAIPGAYTVIAIENGWDLEWAEPAVLAQYLKHGQTIEVGGRSVTDIHLADAVEVQGK